MRLFVALVPPPAVLTEVDEAVGPHRAVWPRLRWVDRSLWHVTLAFLGDVPDRSLKDLSVRLARAAARHNGLELSFAGAGAFPASGVRARVVWTGVYGDRRALTALSSSVAAGARRAGAEESDHKHRHPHLTLARCREPTDVRPLVEALACYAGMPWTSTEVVLMRSHLGSSVRYEALEAWPLRSTT